RAALQAGAGGQLVGGGRRTSSPWERRPLGTSSTSSMMDEPGLVPLGYALQTQPPVQLEDATAVVVVLEQVGRRMGDFLGLAHAPQGNAGGHLLQCLGLHAGGHLGFDEARCNAG